ncbi:GGDEF domain-containing protein [Pontibaca methylaminivorans]|uniref:GGDEF domain-containing protein n=1 Tax=Pontibaca methylaminivorans TaxID=515897 RepID=UPI002FD9D992
MTGEISLPRGALDLLCPMHALLDGEGRFHHAGPALLRLGGDALVGQRFLDVFAVTRPRGVDDHALLRGPVRLQLELRHHPDTTLRGIAVPVADGALVNLGFGISVRDAVRDHGLGGSDFAPTDPTVEMLYLLEAKSAAMGAAKRLALRLEGARAEAEERALSDPLTGLANRRALDLALARMGAAGEGVSVMQLDLDRFKTVNDTMGHAAGDKVLRQVAQIMTDAIRGDDIVARLGGDEFVLVFKGITAPSRLAAIARRLIGALERPIPLAGGEIRISASIGIARAAAAEAWLPARLLEMADHALYRAKRAGRGRYFLHGPITGTGGGRGAGGALQVRE